MRVQRGVTLIELTIATAVAAVLSAAALQLFAAQIGYSRLAASQADLQDRARVLREIITHDIMQSGYYWSKEGMYTAPDPDVPTGVFGQAGMGEGLALGNWPAFPVSSAEGGSGAPDVLYLLRPSGEVYGLNGRRGGNVSADYFCREGGGQTMTYTIPRPCPSNLDGWKANNILVVAGTGYTFLARLTADAACSNGTTGQVATTGVDSCAVAGESVHNDPMPGRLSGYPIEGVAWVVDADNVKRCSSTLSTDGGPLQWSNGSACADSFIAMKGVEDLQIRWRFAVMTLNADGTASSVKDVYSEVPGDLTDPATTLTLRNSDGSSHSTTLRKLRNGVEADAAQPTLRFVGVDIGTITRAQKEDRGYAGRGLRPALFNRDAAGSSDGYRRQQTVWRVVTPNAFVY